MNSREASIRRTPSWFAAVAAFLGLSVGALSPSYGAVTVTYLHQDALGSPVAATDEAGALKWRETYEPYGRRTRDEATSAPQKVFYAGHSEDEAFGLVDMGARSYDPALGRFLATDPVSVTDDPRTFNRYAYAANNPYVYVDTDGRIFETALDVVSLGISVAAFAAAPGLGNGLALAWDGIALVVPGLPGGAGLLRHGAKGAAEAAAASATAVKIGHVKPEKVATGLNYIRDIRMVDDIYPGTGRNIFEVFLHGPDRATNFGTTHRDGGIAVFAQQVIRDIRADSRSAGAESICLNICFGASNGLAQQIADGLGRPVEAFVREAWFIGSKPGEHLLGLGADGTKVIVKPRK